MTTKGLYDFDSFWSLAKDIGGMIKGFNPPWALACGCGGPLRKIAELNRNKIK